jgi:hypothetical protein
MIRPNRNLDEGVTLDDGPARDDWYRTLRTPPKHKQSAVIVREATTTSEPYAQLEDGRVMPMGWNGRNAPFAKGTVGIAEYVMTPSMSLWQFTAGQVA